MTSASPTWTFAQKTIVLLAVLAQFVVAVIIGTGHYLVSPPGAILPPIALSAFVPVMLFVAAYMLFAPVRRFVMAQDLRWLSAIQLWRVVGFAFLLLYAFSVLPGLFAWPAGLGDVAVGIAALFVIRRLERDADYATSGSYLWFNAMGLLDFAVAVVAAAATTGAFPALVSGGITSAPMEIWPLNIFPSFLVPFFIIVHLMAFLKVRALKRASEVNVDAVVAPQV